MDVLNDLVAALKARLPGIHLRTLEEPRAILALRKSVASLSGQLVPRVLWRWSSASGLWQLGLTDEPTDKPVQEQCAFDEAMNEFRKSNDNVVLALLDPWDELSRPLYQRFLREALAHARGSGKAIVLVGKDWNVPVELQPDIFICDLRLPKRSDLEEYIQALAVIYAERLADKVSIDKGCIPELARACTGLTLDETKSIVSLSLVRYRAIGADAIRMAIREKKQIVARGGMLEYEEPERSMSDVGGLVNLKDWLTGSELEAVVQSALIEAFNAGGRKPTEADVAKALKATVPLSKTMADSIGALREFCKSGRAIPAGATLEDDEAKQAVKGAALEL